MLLLQLVNARYEKGAMILTSNRGFADNVEEKVGRLRLTASPGAFLQA